MTISLFKEARNTPLQKVPELPLASPDCGFFANDILTAKNSCAAYASGIAELKSGRFDWDYNYDEIALVLDGELISTDKETG